MARPQQSPQRSSQPSQREQIPYWPDTYDVLVAEDSLNPTSQGPAIHQDMLESTDESCQHDPYKPETFHQQQQQLLPVPPLPKLRLRARRPERRREVIFELKLGTYCLVLLSQPVLPRRRPNRGWLWLSLALVGFTSTLVACWW